jgi:hypothetical protein
MVSTGTTSSAILQKENSVPHVLRHSESYAVELVIFCCVQPFHPWISEHGVLEIQLAHEQWPPLYATSWQLVCAIDALELTLAVLTTLSKPAKFPTITTRMNKISWKTSYTYKYFFF